MSQTMENVDQVITDNNVRITNIITNLQSIINNIEDNNGEIKNILVNISNVSNTFSKIDFNNTFNNIDELLENINNKKGNIGKLLNDDKIYNNLLQSTDELSELIKDIKENPSRYMNFSLIGGKNHLKSKIIKMNISNIIFIVVFILAISIFTYNLQKIISNIKLGKSINRSDNKKKDGLI